MKKASFIVGLIGGIFGIIGCLILTIVSFGKPVTDSSADVTIILGIVGVLISIMGLVGACIVKTKKGLAGTFLIISAIINLLCGMFSISADSPASFIICFVAMILFLVSGIIALCSKNS